MKQKQFMVSYFINKQSLHYKHILRKQSVKATQRQHTEATWRIYSNKETDRGIMSR